MIASPASSFAASSVTVLSVISPAGTITQAARGLLELGDEVLERVGAGRALAGERRDRVGVDVVDDALVAVAHQPADEVRAHPPEADHAELHGPDTKRDARCRLVSGSDGDRGRHPRDLRDHRRPGEEDDLRGALPARAPRRAQLPPDPRDRAQQVGPRRARRPRARGDRGQGRTTPTRRRSSGSTSGSTTSRASSTSRTLYQRLADRDGRVRAGGLLPRDPAVAVRDRGQAPRTTPG